MPQYLSKVEIIVDPKYPNKAWVSQEELRKYQPQVKHFLDFLKHKPTETGTTTFTISPLEISAAHDLIDFFESYRDSLGLPRWLQIKIG